MKFLKNLFRNFPIRRKNVDIGWFQVKYNDKKISMYADPPKSDPWDQELLWEYIIRICYQVEEFPISDGIYIFTTKRPESYVIPIEGIGGHDLWLEILRRHLFDSELAIQVASSVAGIYCWPVEKANAKADNNSMEQTPVAAEKSNDGTIRRCSSQSR